MKSTRSLATLAVIFALITYVPSSNAAIESGTSDSKPTHSTISCGGILCSYFAGKYFRFGAVDNDTFGDFGDIGQYPCQVDLTKGTDFCRVFPKNAIPSSNLNQVILKNGYVEISNAVTCDPGQGYSCRLNEVFGMKIVLSGKGAKFDQYPNPGFTFSNDRKTMFVTKSASFVTPYPRIVASEIATIDVIAYLEVNPSEYSASPSESGKILVVSKNDRFIYQVLTQEKLKKSPGLKLKLMQREITCAKGKATKKVLKTNIYDITCPAGYKIK